MRIRDPKRNKAAEGIGALLTAIFIAILICLAVFSFVEQQYDYIDLRCDYLYPAAEGIGFSPDYRGCR